MKKFFITIILGTFTLIQAIGQATLPSIMVRPGRQWCATNGYMTTQDNQGQTTEVCDYIKAMNDPKMLQSIVEIEALLKDEGFKVPSMQALTERINETAAEDMFDDDEEGNIAEKSPLDLLRERAVADIYLDLNWTIEKLGPKKQLSYTLMGKDAYTGDDVCSVTGLGDPSMAASEATMLREAVIGKIPEMKERLQNYLTSILNNGRAVSIEIRVSTNSNMHLQSPVEGGTLGRIIQKWIQKNAVQHRASAERSSRTSAKYSANIPLYDMDELPMSAEDFTWQLSDYLASSPYNIQTRVSNRGLGNAVLYIQGK